MRGISWRNDAKNCSRDPPVTMNCASVYFQAEGGIRVLAVTGVQTCALPISFGYDRAAMSGEVFHPYGYVFQPTGDISELDWRSETVTLDYAGSAEAQLTNALKATFSA